MNCNTTSSAFSALETCKKYFMSKDYEKFINEVKNNKFKLYIAEYKYSSDYKDATEYIIRNRILGMCQNLSYGKKNYFVAIKVSEDKIFTTYWITYSDLGQILEDDYHDFNWTEVNDSVENSTNSNNNKELVEGLKNDLIDTEIHESVETSNLLDKTYSQKYFFDKFTEAAFAEGYVH